MKLVKAAAAALNQTPLAWDDNKTHIASAIDEARGLGVSLLCLPELCITGYGCEDAFQSPGLHRYAQQVLLELLPETTGMIVSFGLPVHFRGGLFNMAALAVDGKLIGLVGKQNLAGEGIHYEPRWFKPWPTGVRAEIDIEGDSYPIGDLLFDCGGVRIGFEICEDAWVAQRPGGALAGEGVDIILNPSASHFAFGKQQIRERFVLEGSRAFGVSYLYANLLGNEAGRIIYDGGTMIASDGKMLAHGRRFSYADSLVTAAVLDIDQTRMARSRIDSFQPVIDGDGDSCISVPFDFPSVDPETTCSEEFDIASSEYAKEEEFCRATALGLFDYLRKSWSRGFVVSLSGGADSAAVATLCTMLVHFATDELGAAGVAKKLSHIGTIDASESPAQTVSRLLCCVYQATRNSSQQTRDAAASVASGLGARFLEFDVDTLVQGYTQMVSTGIGRELTWQHDDLALQNIQARVRAPGVWMLANIEGALLLSTSNRSEAAVGYATMDGDTSGGLCPIGGIDKAFLRHWLRWMEETGPAGVGPISALAAVNQLEPTAELRPPSSGQTDEDDLMPYVVLDAIERCAIRDKQTPVEVCRTIEPQFSQYTLPQLGQWVERFFRLWCRNQWKRERYAPSFHMDDENLDPKTWCRFPILSGGFRRELDELRQYLQAHGES